MLLTIDDILRVLPEALDDLAREYPNFRPAITTSLLIQQQVGGNIMQCRVGSTEHYFNELDGGMWLDATRSRFTYRWPPRNMRRNPPIKIDYSEHVEALQWKIRDKLGR